MGTTRTGPEDGGPVVSLEDYRKDPRASPFHGADLPDQGKGSRSRVTDREAYARRYDRIDWSDGKDSDGGPEGAKTGASEVAEGEGRLCDRCGKRYTVPTTEACRTGCGRCDGWGCKFCTHIGRAEEAKT